MNVDGPQTLTVGVVNTIVDPAETGNPSVAVQIQNSSPYQLSVLAAGDGYSIQPFFAQTIPIAGGVPIQITPLAQTGLTAACSLTLTFLLGTASGDGVQLPGGTWVETPPQQDGPLTAAAIASALSTQGTVDFLGSGGPTALSPTVVALPSVTALHAYATLILVLETYSVGATEFTATVNRITGGIDTVFPSISFVKDLSPVISDAMFLPVACLTGDALTITITANKAGNLTWAIYGSTIPIANPFPTRSDGRPYPLGLNTISTTIAGVGSNTLISPLGAGRAALLHTLNFFAFTGAGISISVNGTIGGVAGPLALAGGGGAVTFPLTWERGLLLDPNTGLSLNCSAAGGFGAATAIYDIVT